MVVGAQPANADATSCLDWLSRGAVHQPATVLMTTKGTLPVTTAAPRSSLCAGMSVSIGISRTNGHDFRNKNATRDRWEGDAYYYYVKFPLTVDDYGTWITRQIAVKDRSGKVAVRGFTSSTTPYRSTARYESTLTGRPTGALRPVATPITGRLRAWHYYGRQVNLQKQQVLVQVKPQGNYAYTTVATATTSRTGTYRVNVDLRVHRGKSVRVAYVSRIATFANDFTYLGKSADSANPLTAAAGPPV